MFEWIKARKKQKEFVRLVALTEHARMVGDIENAERYYSAACRFQRDTASWMGSEMGYEAYDSWQIATAPVVRDLGDWIRATKERLGYRETCPKCGKKDVLEPPLSTFYAICPACKKQVYMGP